MMITMIMIMMIMTMKKWQQRRRLLNGFWIWDLKERSRVINKVHSSRRWSRMGFLVFVDEMVEDFCSLSNTHTHICIYLHTESERGKRQRQIRTIKVKNKQTNDEQTWMENVSDGGRRRHDCKGFIARKLPSLFIPPSSFPFHFHLSPSCRQIIIISCQRILGGFLAISL